MDEYRYFAVCFTDDINEWCVDIEKMFNYKQVIVKTNSKCEAVHKAYRKLEEEEQGASKWMLCGVVDVTDEDLMITKGERAYVL